ncbi:MAG: AAA family ATPase [Thermoplasmata archaeon]|nr:AAA family ATPase [Thermoplasmata archaeon]
MARLTVNTGGLPFGDIRDGGKYYVDKTLLIKDILDMDDRGVYLFARPRRFGKTTNISMLDAFFNIEYKGNNWFDGLEISNHHEYDPYRNAFPVIHLDFQNTTATTFDMFLNMVRKEILRAYKRHRYLLEGNLLPDERRIFEELAMRDMPEDDLSDSVKLLSEMLYRYHGVKVIVLIDEYDRAVTHAFDTELLANVIRFMGNLMSSTLKGNLCLQMAYVTGVMQLAKAGMFSGMNNINVDSVLSTMSDERFGFTEAEVRNILDYYGHADKLGEVMEWYDGYRFGSADVYNPYSVMMYVSKGFVPGSYWADVGGIKPMVWMFGHMDPKGLGIATTLFGGSSEAVKLRDSMTYDDLRLSKAENLYTLMVLSGYCRAEPDGGKYRITIPNKEVRGILDSMLEEAVTIPDTLFERFNRAVAEGDADSIASAVQCVLDDSSYYEELEDERSFELIVLTMLHGQVQNYDIRAQPERGNGRADIILTPRSGDVVPIIIELKVSASEDSMDGTLDEALQQIHDRKYYMGMSGRVVLIGMAFFRKTAACRTEILDLRAPPKMSRRSGQHPQARRGCAVRCTGRSGLGINTASP